MTNSRNTKKSLYASALALLLCFVMLIGTTFAWFTDSASTGVNTITAGNLKVGMYYADGEKDVPTEAGWTDAKGAQIFNYNLWEPGYTVAKHIKIANEGNLALKYKVDFAVENPGTLAEVIDVYFVDPAQKIDNRAALSNLTPVGTLAKVLAGGVDLDGSLDALKSDTFTIVLKMQESAGNAYQDATVGDLTIHLRATQETAESDSFDETYDEDAIYATVLVGTVDEFKTAVANAKDGDSIGLKKGTYNFDNATLNIDKAISIVGTGTNESVLQNVIFDVDSSSSNHEMEATFENLKFEDASRIIVGNRSHHNGVGGPDALPTTKLTVRNCYAETTFKTDSLSKKGGKGQFIYLAATYTVKLDLTLVGNTMINAHTIEGEDAAPIVNGNGTVIDNVYIANNTFGDSYNPCDRFAVKFGRRANDTSIVITGNTVYGATTADKDFYILDLWQSGGDVQNGLDVTVNNNVIKYTEGTNRTVYAAYIESTVKGSDINVSATGNTINDVLNEAVIK